MDKRSFVVSESTDVSSEHTGPNIRIETVSTEIDGSVDSTATGVAKQVKLSATGRGFKVDDLLHGPDAVGDSGAVRGASTLTAKVISSELSVPSEPPSCTRKHSSRRLFIASLF